MYSDWVYDDDEFRDDEIEYDPETGEYHKNKYLVKDYATGYGQSRQMIPRYPSGFT